jgi:hypothetical protein
VLGGLVGGTGVAEGREQFAMSVSSWLRLDGKTLLEEGRSSVEQERLGAIVEVWVVSSALVVSLSSVQRQLIATIVTIGCLGHHVPQRLVEGEVIAVG